jgi:hypothetical protein
VNEKTNLRYTGFRAADDGGRVFEFSISANGQVTLPISIEIPKEFFEGSNRIQLQEGVGVSYAKLKHLLTLETAGDIPQSLCFTAMDMAQYRQVPMESKRRWRHGDKKADTNSNGPM